MNKFTLFSVIFMSSLIGMSAQISKNPAFYQLISGQGVETRSGSITWGYSSGEILVGVGNNTEGVRSAAICVPASAMVAYKGNQVTKVRIGLADNGSNGSVFIRNSLEGSDVISQKMTTTKGGWNEVQLSTPFKIADTDFYVGYKVTGKYIMGFSGTTNYNGCWLLDGSQWYNYSDYGWGSLCIQLVIEGDKLPENEVTLMQVEKIYTDVNKQFNIQATVKNNGTKDITTLSFDIATVPVSGGGEIPSNTIVKKTVKNITIASGGSATVAIPYDVLLNAGIYNMNVTITSVNDKQDINLSDNSASAMLEVIKKKYARKVVVEEGTGTWCGWCPRGTVGMAMMKQKYPDTFVGISPHYGDEMAVSGYDQLINELIGGSYPSCIVDRSLVGDPGPNSIELLYKEALAVPTQASVALKGSFNSAKTKIELTTTVQFGFTGKGNCKLAYVLIENGVTGYTQSNYYAGGGNGSMGGYENRPASITDMVYDDVARGIYSSPTGVEGSIPATVKELTNYTHQYTITLPNTIKNKNKLDVAVLLLNEFGEVMNADKIDTKGIISANEAISNDISVWSADGTVHILAPQRGKAKIYDVTGRMITEINYESGTTTTVLPKGLFIVKTDNKAYKILNSAK